MTEQNNTSKTKRLINWSSKTVLLPIRAGVSAFKLGRGSGGMTNEERRENAQEFHSRLVGAIRAIKNPPTWQSIEEMEAGWKINDSNRVDEIRGRKVVRGFYLVLLIAALYYLSSFGLSSTLEIILTLSVTTALFAVMSMILSISWQLHCLEKRDHINFIQYLKGEGK